MSKILIIFNKLTKKWGSIVINNEYNVKNIENNK